VLHKSLNPGQPLMMNIRFRVYNNQDIPEALGKTRIMHSSKGKNQAEFEVKMTKLIYLRVISPSIYEMQLISSLAILVKKNHKRFEQE
jgi:hypothetical protein